MTRENGEAAERLNASDKMRWGQRDGSSLRESDEWIRLAVESANIGTWDFNPVTREKKWSERAKMMFGLAPDADENSVSFLERVHPEHREPARRAVKRALDPTGDGAFEIDGRLIWPDGTVRWLIAKGQAFFEGADSRRRATRFIGTVFDITERKQAEEALRASESRLQAIMDNTSAIIYVKDSQNRLQMVNRRFREVFNVTAEQIIGKTDADLFPTDIVAKLQANDLQVRRTGQPLEFEEVAPQSDGLHTYLSVKFPIYDPASQSNTVGGISTDITDRTKALEALRAEQELLRHTIELQDRERQLIVYEIHDGLVQYATGALMQLEALQDQVSPADVADQIGNVVEILRSTVAEGRRLINGIRTPVLDDLGIVAAIEQLLEEEDRAHVRIEFIRDAGLPRMLPQVEEALYRIVQEALTNIRKHSQSTKIQIELRRSGDRLLLAVRDWGLGFNVEKSSKDVHGLEGMQRRAALAGGQCTVESELGGGTIVKVDLPFVISHQGPEHDCLVSGIRG